MGADVHEKQPLGSFFTGCPFHKLKIHVHVSLGLDRFAHSADLGWWPLLRQLMVPINRSRFEGSKFSNHGRILESPTLRVQIFQAQRMLQAHMGMGQDLTTRTWTASFLVRVSIYQGNTFWGYTTIFDRHSPHVAGSRLHALGVRLQKRDLPRVPAAARGRGDLHVPKGFRVWPPAGQQLEVVRSQLCAFCLDVRTVFCQRMGFPY